MLQLVTYSQTEMLVEDKKLRQWQSDRSTVTSTSRQNSWRCRMLWMRIDLRHRPISISTTCSDSPRMWADQDRANLLLNAPLTSATPTLCSATLTFCSCPAEQLLHRLAHCSTPTHLNFWPTPLHSSFHSHAYIIHSQFRIDSFQWFCIQYDTFNKILLFTSEQHIWMQGKCKSNFLQLKH